MSPGRRKGGEGSDVFRDAQACLRSHIRAAFSVKRRVFVLLAFGESFGFSSGPRCAALGSRRTPEILGTAGFKGRKRVAPALAWRTAHCRR